MWCDKYENMFHQSCAKLAKGVLVISDSQINCCAIKDSEPDPDDALLNALECVTVSSKVDVNIFAYIIKQKDMLISELQDKIKLLNDHIKVLNRVNEVEKNGHDILATTKNYQPKTAVDRRSDKNSTNYQNKPEKVCNKTYLLKTRIKNC